MKINNQSIDKTDDLAMEKFQAEIREYMKKHDYQPLDISFSELRRMTIEAMSEEEFRKEYYRLNWALKRPDPYTEYYIRKLYHSSSPTVMGCLDDYMSDTDFDD